MDGVFGIDSRTVVFETPTARMIAMTPWPSALMQFGDLLSRVPVGEQTLELNAHFAFEHDLRLPVRNGIIFEPNLDSSVCDRTLGEAVAGGLRDTAPIVRTICAIDRATPALDK